MLDLQQQAARKVIDQNTSSIDWHGIGGDRGLRGIAFDKDTVYVAGSDQLFAFSPDFRFVRGWHNRYLKHCHNIAVWGRTLYLSSAGSDSILGFCLDKKEFNWAMRVQSKNYRYKAVSYDPNSEDGPLLLNKLHLNNVFCSEHGMYISGLRTGGMLHFNGTEINMAVQLPAGARDARPFRDGVLFNDTESHALRYTGRGDGQEDRAMVMTDIENTRLRNTDAIEENMVRTGFARGLCVLSDHTVAGGSSPATVSIYDLAANEQLGSVVLSNDVRESIHSIALWPYD